LKLADLLRAFCDDHVAKTSDEAVDGLIDNHVRELRQQELTRLPEDRETLIRMFERLQMRKDRRLQRGFYTMASEARISDLILRLMDEEIDAGGEVM
jgi:hypothetical protein